MKIKTKSSIFSFIWLIVILLPLFFVIYYYYAQFEKEEELEILQNTANEILKHISASDLLYSENSLLINYLPNHSMIRSINQTSTVKNQAFNSIELLAIPPQYSDTPQSYYDMYNNEKVIIVRAPITCSSGIIGTLEIISEPLELEQSLYRLIMILCFVAVAAIIVSFSGSFLLSRVLFSPLLRMIKVMKEIETGLEIRKLPLNRKAKDELYQLSETFNHMMERIETSMQKQRQFISDASHEFKTSLTIIEGYTSLIRRWGFENIDLHTEALDAIHAESNRMKHVTYQLLDLAELEHEMKLSNNVFDLVSLCKETMQLLKPLSRKEILLIHSFKSLLIDADRLRIKQVLLITLDNALKYANQSIEIHLEDLISHLRIRIVDDGIGIPSEELPFIFERFYRVDRSRNRQTGGSGLGLAIAKSIVSLHHGTIQINSERNCGTEVIISLPSKKPSDSN